MNCTIVAVEDQLRVVIPAKAVAPACMHASMESVTIVMMELTTILTLYNKEKSIYFGMFDLEQANALHFRLA